MADKLPPEICTSETFKTVCDKAESFATCEISSSLESDKHEKSNGNPPEDHRTEERVAGDSVSKLAENDRSSTHQHSPQSDPKPQGIPGTRNGGEKESIEQFEPGVYITFVQRQDGTKMFKRVRFRYFL